jgi:uroporphyrinogen-III synthase
MHKPMHAADGPLLLVTRPAEQAAGWVSKLRAQGLRAEALPLIAIGPAPDAKALRQMLAALQPGALVMFVSPNAVQQTAAALGGRLPWPEGVRAAATGPGTVAALQAAGVRPGQIVAPDEAALQFDSEALWQLLQHEDWRGRQVRVVRGEGGREWFAETLRAAGAEVQLVQGYSRCAATLDAAGRALLHLALAQPQDCVWLFSSSEGIDHVMAMAPQADWAASVAWVSHPRIAETARARGWRQVSLLPPGLDAIVHAVRTGPTA